MILVPQKLLSQIKKNNPNLEDSYAKNLAVVIQRVSNKYDIEPRLVSAIAMQESAYDLKAKQCYKLGKSISCDFCMMQINNKTVDLYGFNKDLLMSSLSYCLEAGVIVLSDFKDTYGNRDKNYWTRFNSSDPKIRETYRKLVKRWM